MLASSDSIPHNSIDVIVMCVSRFGEFLRKEDVMRNWWSVNGIGFTLNSFQKEPDGKIRFTSWISVFYFPLLPLASYSARYAGEFFPDGITSDGMAFCDVQRVPMDWRLVGRTYASAIALFSSFAVPLAYLIFRTDGRAATSFEMVIMFAFAAWPTALYFLVERRRKSFLQQSSSASSEIESSGQTAYSIPSDDWDDASLFSEMGLRAWNRYARHGFESLNETEEVFCPLFVFDGDVHNGGFGMWIGSASPKILEATLPAFKTVGASEMALFVGNVLARLGDLGRFETLDEWQEHFESLPEDFHNSLENYSIRFLELEDAFMDSVYNYARNHWREVRIA